jgi:hypothetical protein
VPTGSLAERRQLIQTVADGMPLAYTAGLRALAAWTQELSGNASHVTVQSATGRSVSFYLGPARRRFGSPEDTLVKGRGRVALLIHRQLVLEPTGGVWEFTPFDLGEVFYHAPGRTLEQYLAGGADFAAKLSEARRPISELPEAFVSFLDAAYEDPAEYLRGWIPPRPALELGTLANAIYGEGRERRFGKFRPFGPAWTFEVIHTDEVVIPVSFIMAVVVIDDGRPDVQSSIAVLQNTLGTDRVHSIAMPPGIEHPDLAPILLEGCSMRLIEQRLGVAR